jgi:thiopeptide-type bacteriocin biosynthesis protein
VHEGFRHAGFFLLRTPLLPVTDFDRFSSGLSGAVPGLTGEALAAALASDRSLLRARLAEIVDEPAVREAIFVASPSLSDSLRYWRQNPDSKRGQRVERSLISYFGRMCMRSTPFGLFSGCTLGRIEGRSELALRGRADHRRATRLDKAYLFAICEDLRHDLRLREELLYTPNSSLYRRGTCYRYAQAVMESAGLTHRLVEVEHGEPLEAALARAARRATVAELAAALVATDPEGGITAEEAHAFVHQLIDAQVLVCDLTPNVTGDEPGEVIVRQLQQLSRKNAQNLAARLKSAQRELAALDAEGLGVSPSRYQGVLPSEAELSELLPANLLKAWPEERLLQVDLFPAADRVTLSPELAAQLLAGAELLHRMRPQTPNGELTRFSGAFVQRYQDREVPLLEALDEEAGIGFVRSASPNVEVSPLLDGILFPPEEKSLDVHWGEREQFLYQRLCAALIAGEREIELAPADVLRLSTAVPPLPDAFSVLASLVGSPEELRSGEIRLHVKWLDGPSGARTLGRFCQVHDELREAVVGYLKDEEAHRPDALYAEVVHLPQGRAANVVCRSVLREHELTFLGRSGAPWEQQIPVADLRVSVVDGRIRLRSVRHDREVVPRLTSAHNPMRKGLGLYRFLLALQSQDRSGGTMWSWGPLEGAPFLPRVTSGRVILAPAQWRLTQDQIAPLTALDTAGRFQAVGRLRREVGLPRVAAVASGDEFVPIDFENLLCVETFVQLASKEGTAIREMLAGPGELCVESPEGLLAHELILPFVRDRGAEKASVRPDRSTSGRAAERAIQRRFGPGSSWLDAKLYSSALGADRLLRQVVAPLVDLGVAERWFFGLERDPELCLRVRFHGASERLHDELLPALTRLSGDLLESEDLRRLALDTYEREVERFGGPEGIELAEQMFWIGSETALQVLDQLDGAAEARWLLALRGGDRVLDDLGFDLAGKVALCRELGDRLFRELRGEDKLRQSLGRRYRADRAKLDALWAPAEETEETEEEASGLGPALAILEQQAERARPVAAELLRRSREGRLTVAVPELAENFLHKNAERLFSTAIQAHELVIYDLLHRFYESRLARSGEHGAARRA